jgi:phosphoesterase RecJ-like protein
MTVTDEMVQKAGAKWEHTEGLVNYARAVEGVECGVMVSPARDGGVRLSLRSKGGVDAGAVCAPFGGGGHRGAAGCTMDVPMAEAKKDIVEALAAACTASS